MATGLKLASYTRESNDKASSLFENADVPALSASVKALFDRLGYRLEEGTPEYGVYGIGSGVLRFLFGVFAKRYRFSITITSEQGMGSLTISKAMTGAMGGVVGYTRMNKEFERIIEELKALS